MKLLKRLLIGLAVLLVLLLVIPVVVLSLIDLNDYKDKIQNLTKTQTGRDLSITGDLNVSYFPWVGISLGELALANAEGFGSEPFAKIDSANVKVELLPLLRKTVNVKTVELSGLSVDLQRAADGTTNWDDLANREPATTSTTTDDTTTEVEGDPAAIAALAVGGVEITNANVSWKDATTETEALLSDFNLKTGAIELAKPFDLTTDFNVNSAGIDADVTGEGAITIDLENQRYTVAGFNLNTNAKGDALPAGAVELTFATDIVADLAAQAITADAISLNVLGVTLNGEANVTQLDTEPTVVASLKSDAFSPAELMTKLGLDAPVTADETVLQSAGMSLSLDATPAAASLSNLTITLDDTTFSGNASLPDLAAATPPVRFDFAVDAIDLDRYLPPTADGEDAADNEGAAPAADTSGDTAGDSGGDTPIDLPLDMIRQLDIQGVFAVGSLKVMNLLTTDINIPLNASNGVVKLDDVSANLYDGGINTTLSLDATGDVPGFGVNAALTKVESDPLLTDLRQTGSPLTGNANFNAAITTAGASVNAIKAGLNGTFDAAFKDGSINGINIGYQIRKAKALFQGQSLSEEQKQIKTDFSSLSMSGTFTNGVLTSDDLDMRSPLLRLSGAGTVDLPQEYLDYTPSIKITGSAEGQGGKDLDELAGVQLDVPLRGKFSELSADFSGVLLGGLKDNLLGNAKARAKAEADKLKAEAKEKLEAERAKAEEKARAELEAKQEELTEKANEAVDKAKDELKGKLKGLLK